MGGLFETFHDVSVKDVNERQAHNADQNMMRVRLETQADD